MASGIGGNRHSGQEKWLWLVAQLINKTREQAINVQVGRGNKHGVE